MMTYYAVKVGKKPGVYKTWDACKEQVHGYKGAVYKKFDEKEQAQSFVQGEPVPEAEQLTEYQGWVAFVDGSYDVKSHAFSYGVVIFHGDRPEEKVELSQAFCDEEWAAMRNVAGELKGAMAALDWAKKQGITELTIVHDYSGIAHWARGEWKAQKKCTMAYRDYIKNLDGIQVQFVKVRAHSGHPLNERADQLAKEALGI